MKSIHSFVAASVFLVGNLAFGPELQGSLVTSGLQQYTQSGATYSFSLANAPTALGSGVLTFEGVGDFNEKLEFVTISINGVDFLASRFLQGPGLVPNPNSTYVVTGVQGSVFTEVKLDELRTSYTLSAATINSLISTGGGSLNFQVRFDNKIGVPRVANGLDPLGSFSTTTFSYSSVPEPTSMALAAVALGALGLRWRTKKHQPRI